MNDTLKHSLSYKYLNKVLVIALAVTVLLQTDLFFNVFYTQLFSLLIVGSLIVIATGVTFFKLNDLKISFPALISLTIILFWGIYIYLNNKVVSTAGPNGTLKSMFLIISFAIYFSLIFFLDKVAGKWNTIFNSIIIVSVIQSFDCVFQSLGIISSNNNSFKVTGLWINPNITAIYLSLALPIVLFRVFEKNKKYRALYITISMLIWISLILLKCRTALLSATAITIIVLEWHIKFLRSYFYNSKKYFRFIIVILAILFIGAITFFTYTSKQASSDSRMLIWRLSLQMIAQKPFTGFGYGTFERNYNLFQANYFFGEARSEKELKNASHTNMAYNEFLENAIEGGIVGLAFFIAFTTSLLVASYVFLKKDSKSNKLANHIIDDENTKRTMFCCSLTMANLLFMSLMNFTLLAVPVMNIFIIYAAIITNISLSTGKLIEVPKNFRRLIAIGLVVTGILFIVNSFKAAFYQKKIKEAIVFAINKNYSGSLAILKAIPVDCRQNEDYYKTLGQTLYFNNKKKEAALIFEKAKTYYSSPELYQFTGDCYAENKESNKAILNYQTAKDIQPNRFSPRFFLLAQYIKLNDTLNIIKAGTEILSLEVKVPSPKVNQYKKFAQFALNKFQKK